MAHEKMLEVALERDAETLIELQAEHRERALQVLRGLLAASGRIGVAA